MRNSRVVDVKRHLVEGIAGDRHRRRRRFNALPGHRGRRRAAIRDPRRLRGGESRCSGRLILIGAAAVSLRGALPLRSYGSRRGASRYGEAKGDVSTGDLPQRLGKQLLHFRFLRRAVRIVVIRRERDHDPLPGWIGRDLRVHE